MNTEKLTYYDPSWYERLWNIVKRRYEYFRDRNKDSSIIQHAKREFIAADYIPLNQPQEDGPNKWMQESILELLKVFSKQGHSGFSAPYCIDVFSKLVKFEPLVPLSGNDDEWNDVGDGIFQNNRCSHVFKNKERFNGQAYDIDAVIFRELNGACYTNSKSSQPITFPYTPERKYVDVPE